MDTFDAIRTRHTVREFQNRRLPAPLLERLLEAGLQAPSNDHLRRWHFILVDEPEQRLRLLERVQKQFTEAEVNAWLDSWNSTDPLQRACYLDAVPRQYRMLLEAGTLLVPVFAQSHPLLKPSNINALNGFASMWCCIQNILIAASAKGVQGVVRIPFENEIPHLRKTLGIPAGWEIPCYLALGYPAEGHAVIRQVPVSVKERLHQGRW